MLETSKIARQPELDIRGWNCVRGITSQTELLELARSLGRPVPSPTGELVKELRPTTRANARRGTLSYTYATGSFPLHTDTAFWPVPTRYIVLRATGDLRRPTKVLNFANLFWEGTNDYRASAERSIWIMRTPSKSFYCSMKFQSDEATGWRYDGQCMSPMNNAAFKVRDSLNSLFTDTPSEYVQWSPDLALVLCNWQVLHGRGPAPSNENGRTLERIYVE